MRQAERSLAANQGWFYEGKLPEQPGTAMGVSRSQKKHNRLIIPERFPSMRVAGQKKKWIDTLQFYTGCKTEGMTENRRRLWERTGVEGLGYDGPRNCACIVFVLLK